MTDDSLAAMLKPAEWAEVCLSCEGSGQVPATPGQPGDGPMPCEDCTVEGAPTGKVPLVRAQGKRSLRKWCCHCKGTGNREALPWGDLVRCLWCSGRGWSLVDEDTYVVVCLLYIQKTHSKLRVEVTRGKHLIFGDYVHSRFGERFMLLGEGINLAVACSHAAERVAEKAAREAENG